jgi:hypothetical protein
MSEIQRYKLVVGDFDAELLPDDFGSYVEYRDHQANIKELEIDKQNAEYCFWELKKINEKLESQLEQANLSDHDKEDLEIGKQIRRAAAGLPDYFDIKIHVENGFAGVTLIDKKGTCRDFDFEERLSSAISEAIDAAIQEKK